MKAIVATDEELGISKNGKLLYIIPEDMKFFRQMTKNRVVVMGRKTYESIGGGLPHRTNFVITHNPEIYTDTENVIFGSLKEVEEKIKEYDTNDIVIIGGERIYEHFLQRCDTIYQTVYNKIYNADTYFPDLLLENFDISSLVYNGIYDRIPYRIYKWVTAEAGGHKFILEMKYTYGNRMYIYSDNGLNWYDVFNREQVSLDKIKFILSKVNSTQSNMSWTELISPGIYRTVLRTAVKSYDGDILEKIVIASFDKDSEMTLNNINALLKLIK